MKTLLLIDANSLVHRAYHALPKTFTSPDGTPSGALFGLSRILLKLLREEPPEYAAACFDRPEPTYREKEYAAYKAQRPKAADELVSQIVEARYLFGKFGVRVFEEPGFEADDLIATLAERFGGEKDLRTVILTGDRDTLQLVLGDRIVVRAPKKGISETIIYDEEEIRRQYGLSPLQLADYKALMGDPSDNIKGVSGVGPKTASHLLQEFGSVEGIYKKMDDTHPLFEKLSSQREEAAQAKRLVTLRRDAPVEADELGDLAVKTDKEVLAGYFQEKGFRTLASSISEGVVGEVRSGVPRRKNKKPSAGAAQGNMF